MANLSSSSCSVARERDTVTADADTDGDRLQAGVVPLAQAPPALGPVHALPLQLIEGGEGEDGVPVARAAKYPPPFTGALPLLSCPLTLPGLDGEGEASSLSGAPT